MSANAPAGQMPSPIGCRTDSMAVPAPATLADAVGPSRGAQVIGAQFGNEWRWA
jgi:hypothetical protein